MMLEGACHCGNLSFEFESDRSVFESRVGACECTFCRAHGARCVSDPGGSATIHVRRAAEISRYRFEKATADFLVCRTCGIYLGALIEVEGDLFSTLNLRSTSHHDLPAPKRRYDHETKEERIVRRAATWTPTRLVIDDPESGPPHPE
jgi:hypothetical protein